MTLRMILGLWVFAIIAAFGVWGLVLTLEQDAEILARRGALPTMERAGEVSINNNALYLWKFEFEGKQCLWATMTTGRDGRGGLTCWEETE